MAVKISQKKQIGKIARKYSLDFVILYGSSARKEEGRLSDVDIGVYRRGGLKKEEMASLYLELAKIFPGKEIDLKSLSGVSPLLRYHAIRDGQLLYGEKTAYNDFRAFAYRDYQEGKPLFALEDLLVRKHQRQLNDLFHD